jgi:rhomboid protease GluP
MAINRRWNKYKPRRPSNGGTQKRQGELKLDATNIIIGVNVAVFVLTKGILGVGGNPMLLRKLMKINRAIEYGQSYRLLTAIFCHGSFYHLGMNCYSLTSLGPMAERAFGTDRFVMTYLLSGVLANLATFFLGISPMSLGASGCTFGLIGAFATHFYRNKRFLGARAEQGLESIKRTVILNLVYGLSMPGIDNGAHMAGLASGALCSYLFGPRLAFGATSSDAYFRTRARVVDRPIMNVRKPVRNFLEWSNTPWDLDRDED